ncbi:MAG: hypothetical protein ACYDH3_02975 [Candidatus Aminicenantales bacterium]
MKKKIWLIGIVGMLALTAGRTAGQGPSVSARRTAFMEQEYGIAKTAKSYFIFDFEDKMVLLKAKGIVLKQWPIAKFSRWGRMTGPLLYTLERKTALNPPVRTDVTPVKSDQAADARITVQAPAPEPKKTSSSDDLDILELVKMPVKYTLVLPDEIKIIVHPQKKGLARFWEGFGRIFSRGIARPYQTIVRAIKKNPFTDIEIVFPEENDAKGVYWSFFEGQKCLIYWPD